jgi:heme exporter protein A
LLDVIDLECVRGDRPLFSGVSFSVRNGEIFHVQGRNGAGKTSLLRILCGLSTPAQGEIRWQGVPIQELGEEYPQHLVYVGHLNGVQGELNAREHLRFLAGLNNRAPFAAIEPALERLELITVADLPVKFLSQGQKRRLALAHLLLLKKNLWILDEPYTTLDTDSIALVEVLLDEHLRTGGLIVMASHQELSLKAPLHRINLDS